MQKTMKKANKNINLLVLPAIIVVAIVTQIPFLLTVILSFVKWIVVRPDMGIKFAGLKNYIRIFTDTEFYGVVFNTFIITALSLLFCTVLGIAISLLLNLNIPKVNIVRTLIIAPFFVMDAVTGVIWKTLMLHPSFGFNGYFASLFNIDPVDFLGKHSLLTIILLIIWQWTPFFVLIILSGLQGISEEIIDGSRVDGANWHQSLFKVKIPMIMNHIEVAIMLGLIFIIKVFGVIYVTTQGGPGRTTTNLPFYIYKVGFYAWDVGRSTAISVVLMICTLVSITAMFNFLRKRFVGVE